MYRPLTFGDFKRKVERGEYESRKAVMLAIRSAAWSDGDRQSARALAEHTFPVAQMRFLAILRDLVATAPELEPHVAAIEKAIRKGLGAADSPAPRPKALKPRAVPPLRLAPNDDSDQLKHDITALFDSPDDDDDPDPDEGPVTQEPPLSKLAGSDPEEVARICRVRPDLENAIAEGDADDTLDEKQKIALRVAVQKLKEMREPQKAGK
jgi:hypothetical protein